NGGRSGLPGVVTGREVTDVSPSASFTVAASNDTNRTSGSNGDAASACGSGSWPNWHVPTCAAVAVSRQVSSPWFVEVCRPAAPQALTRPPGRATAAKVAVGGTGSP